MNYEIKKGEWGSFLVDLSRRRYEWKTCAEVLRPDFGDEPLCDGLPFSGITLEHADDGDTLVMSFGEYSDSHLTHCIGNPTRMAFLEAPNGEEVLDIEEADGTKTLVRFIEPMRMSVGRLRDVSTMMVVG
jgi:hypothetical protein